MKKNLFLKIHKKNPVAKSLFKKVTDRSLSSYVVARMCSVKISSKFTGEHPCLSVMSIKLLCRFIEITLCHGCSPVNLLHIFRTPFLKNTSGRLLLYAATSLKERTPTKVFSEEFWEVLKTPFLQNTSRQ